MYLKKIFNNKILRIIVIILTSVFLFLILLRGAILRYAFNGFANKLKDRYSLVADYGKLKPYGVSGVVAENLYLYQQERDTLFRCSYLKARVNIWSLMLLKIDLLELEMNNTRVNFVKGDSISNFDFIFPSSPDKKMNSQSETEREPSSKRVSLSTAADWAISLLMRVLPSNATINDFTLSYIKGDYNLSLHLEELLINDNIFNTQISSNENGYLESLIVRGSLNDYERRVSADVSAENRGRFTIPFLDFRWGARVMFDSLAFNFTASPKKGGTITLQGNSAFYGISLFHKGISRDTILLNRAKFEYKTLIGHNFVEMDSSTVASVNDLSLSPYLLIKRDERATQGADSTAILNGWIVTASVNKPMFDSDTLFRSLPVGLFTNLEGIKTSGRVEYHFYTNIDFSNPDSLKLESSLRGEKFRIESFGNVDFRYVNSDFEYTAYENGVPVRTLWVGPSNPNFRPLESISQYLQVCVLQSEDGGFFYHNGFLPESIREAMVVNIKDRRFRRGGSTISMQLVKNLFLSRNKTLARKVEEMLIVWLIENNRLISKERMFEIYLNIIEWGPGIYGITEASHFYFHKEPFDLTINESIFLASIIPSPKRALRDLETYNLSEILNNGQIFALKPGYEEYHKLLMSRLQAKGF